MVTELRAPGTRLRLFAKYSATFAACGYVRGHRKR